MIGVAINELGETQRISVLAAPLLGVFAWNIAVYLALLVAFVAALLTAPRHARQATAPSRIARYIVALSLRADETRGSARIAPSSDIQPIVADAMRRFQDDWSAFIAPLYTAQARALPTHLRRFDGDGRRRRHVSARPSHSNIAPVGRAPF